LYVFSFCRFSTNGFVVSEDDILDLSLIELMLTNVIAVPDRPTTTKIIPTTTITFVILFIFR
jgi:hypothetical protein